jgi:predicted enzyme related to lactoylglutathione lyase
MGNPVVHFEIPADDLARAQAFYHDAFGWTLTTMPELNYTSVGTTPTDDKGMPTEPGAINGGMFQRQAPLNTPVITVQVDDVDEALARIEKFGGKQRGEKISVGDMGTAAYFTDSEGNLMGLWQTAR